MASLYGVGSSMGGADKAAVGVISELALRRTNVLNVVDTETDQGCPTLAPSATVAS